MSLEHASSPVSVVVKSADPRFACDIATALRTRPRIRVLRPDQEGRAEALLVLATELDDDTLSLMGGDGRPPRARGPRVVLVVRAVGFDQLLRAVEHGVVSVLSRGVTGLDQIALALLRTRAERLHLPIPVLAEGLQLRHRTQGVDGTKRG
ncbi:hypothetical protein [Streptomyces sp. NPDC048277]|uniref:hypothetical protein n=1 Tax=Streptomyces sp. NPDC048277 TaxID=3155027 RepID=UPI0033E7BCFF